MQGFIVAAERAQDQAAVVDCLEVRFTLLSAFQQLVYRAVMAARVAAGSDLYCGHTGGGRLVESGFEGEVLKEDEEYSDTHD
jgi:hypothetical protein